MPVGAEPRVEVEAHRFNSSARSLTVCLHPPIAGLEWPTGRC